MPLKNHIKDAPKSLKEKIIVPDFNGDETAKEQWIQIQKQQKLQELESWVGVSFEKAPTQFIEEMSAKLGLCGFQLKPRDKWQGQDGMLLYLRVFKTRYELKKQYKDFIGVEVVIRNLPDFYPGIYKDSDVKSLIARYNDKRTKLAPSICSVIQYLESTNKSVEEKIAFIDMIEKALASIK